MFFCGKAFGIAIAQQVNKRYETASGYKHFAAKFLATKHLTTENGFEMKFQVVFRTKKALFGRKKFAALVGLLFASRFNDRFLAHLVKILKLPRDQRRHSPP